MKKSDTIALHKEAFLEGKDEIDRRRFEEKSLDKQYGSIMAWKRRQNLAKAPNDKSAATIINSLKAAWKMIPELQELPQKEAEKMLSLAESIASDVKNFDLIKKSQLLDKLKSQRESLDREIEMLEASVNQNNPSYD